ncbi:MAG: SEC-C metal-binding domain-containing protein [Bacillota bacterium]
MSSLHEQWKELADTERSEKEYNEFWNTYLEKETKNYENILEKHDEVISGKLSELSEKFDMDPITFIGFMDGINTSLVESVNLDELSEDSDVKLEVDYEKLYYNMLDAKAHWLYNLPQWDDVLSKDRRNEITKDYNRDHIAVSNKVGRNDPCPCGSGKKYKKCCGV